jgi:prepilin-type N-terminal cleavage/methylation domain-containing protein
MTVRNTKSVRAGFTLIELLVVMSLTAALGALTLGLLPGIVNKDNTLKATAEVQGALRIAQGHAASTKHPRGVRFLPNPTNPAVATEMQYLEAPEVVVSDLQVLVQGRPQPYVQFNYDYDANGQIVNRHCYLFNITAEQLAVLGGGAAVSSPGATLSIPPLGTWSQISGFNPTSTTSGEALLDVYPDPYLGAAGPPRNGRAQNNVPIYRSYHFGIYGAPVPQLGEPTVPLPKDIAVDLPLCLPLGLANGNYDVMFAPNGQTITSRFTNGTQTTQIAANAGVYLWVRDVTKVPGLTPLSRPTVAAPGAPWVFTYNDFLRGGEQQVVGIRNGYVGTAPVLWPATSGGYGAGQDPYTLARQQLD